ncbi:M20/M25/M40 family metallo-hydrolase, partial [Cupriavidus sp. ISTL7]
MAARRSPAFAPSQRFLTLPAALSALAAAAGLLCGSALLSPALAQTATPAAAQSPTSSGDPALHAQIETRAKAAEARLIAWRRDIHQHPELGNYETRTAKLVADHLRKLGMDVKTGVAKTGVVGLLKGGKPGPVVALRADMDALPVKERVDVPFASKAKGKYLGKEVDVMHACGHDTHVAILMA